MDKNKKKPGIIIYEEGKRYNSVDDMERRPIKSFLSKDKNNSNKK